MADQHDTARWGAVVATNIKIYKKREITSLHSQINNSSAHKKPRKWGPPTVDFPQSFYPLSHLMSK